MSPRIAGFFLRRNAYWLYPVARLKPGISRQQAEAEIQTISRRLAMQYPDSNAGMSTELVDLRQADCRPGTARPGGADGCGGIRAAHHLREPCWSAAGAVPAPSERKFPFVWHWARGGIASPGSC
jgi:hypothetical protein